MRSRRCRPRARSDIAAKLVDGGTAEGLVDTLTCLRLVSTSVVSPRRVGVSFGEQFVLVRRSVAERGVPALAVIEDLDAVHGPDLQQSRLAAVDAVGESAHAECRAFRVGPVEGTQHADEIARSRASLGSSTSRVAPDSPARVDNQTLGSAALRTALGRSHGTPPKRLVRGQATRHRPAQRRTAPHAPCLRPPTPGRRIEARGPGSVLFSLRACRAHRRSL